MKIEINLVNLLKNNLNINEYLTIHKIAKTTDGYEFPFTSDQSHLDSLEKDGWLTQSDESVELTNKSKKLIKWNIKGITEEHFDKLFEMYPYRTPGGRVLRSRHKIIASSMTKNYSNLRDKYLRKVNSIELHDTIMESISKMLSDAKMRGGMDYLQQLDTFINQNSWEKYMGNDSNEVQNQSNIIKL